MLGIAALIAADAYRTQRFDENTVVGYPTRLRLFFPYLLVLLATITLLVTLLRPEHHLSTSALGLLFGTVMIVLLIIFRQWLTLEENRHLYGELQASFQEVSALASIDPITRLPNYRYLMERLAQEITRADRYETPVALIFIDIDLFKMVNDTYGHWAGDIVLQHIAAALQSTARATDILGRYGGEEFVVLLPETALSEARTLAERMRRHIEEMRIPLESGETVTLTISAGLSAYPHPSGDLHALVTDADAAMYRAKRAGRNGVAIARESSSLTLSLSAE